MTPSDHGDDSGDDSITHYLETTPLLHRSNSSGTEATLNSVNLNPQSALFQRYDLGNGFNVYGQPVIDLEDESSDPSLLDRWTGFTLSYADFTSIDWVRDYIKERARIRGLRQLIGWRGPLRIAGTLCLAGGGISEVKTILGGFVLHGFLGIKTMLLKAPALVFCVASGLTIGQQGPLVHISCCIGNAYARLFPKYALNEGKKREILSAATAAGVSVAFAAPIGGVLFSLEEVSYYFPLKTMWRSFFCTMTAVMTLKLLNPYGSGKLVKFQVQYTHDWKDFELIPFALLGLIGGTYGALFIRFTNFLAAIRKHKYFPFSPFVEVLVLAFITAVVNQRTSLLRLSLNEIKENLQSVLSVLYPLLAVKTLLVLFSNGLRVPGGIVGSSMLVGACVGRTMGVMILQFQQAHPDHFLSNHCVSRNACVTPGIYALVGGAAALCGVSRMTVSLVVVMLELTGALKLSSYDATITRGGYPYLDHKRDLFPPASQSIQYAGDAAEHEPIASFQVQVEYTWHEMQEKLDALSTMADGGFAVLNGTTLLGYISYADVKHCVDPNGICLDLSTRRYYFKDVSVASKSCLHSFGGTDLSPWMDAAPLTVSSRASLDLVLQLFMKMGCKLVCVVDGAGGAGKFVGVITKKRIIALMKDA
ncbi:hypothetical protein BCR33DRAFT_847377 [Rhizoclosmatium globosum]|uniref:Chloride channel protein n=1 Tax=Rhizoclosmatium globosum TaxID=329046 RepID=A0A1Y2CQS6_9FUNG|nr:hypothetical protein BCR33DRAFT_847377 [Rhizoclosmatium globosum]|eukprot:ORY49381.1 hypothetical protein BCR33DRAFT_847377 [Rhizoclosmatium globosum]